MKYKNDDIFYEAFRDLEENEIAKIAEEIPPLDSKAKKRILNSSLKKLGCDEPIEDFEPEITVSGTEKISNLRLKRLAAAAASFALISVGISGVALINRNLSGSCDNSSESDSLTIVKTDSDENAVYPSGSENCEAEIMTRVSSSASVSSKNKTIFAETATSCETQIDEIEVETSAAVCSEVAATENSETAPLDTTADAVHDEAESQTTVDESDITTTDYDFCGTYDMLYSESGDRIEIRKTGDNLYSIELSFYRIAYFSDGIGNVDENGNLTFSTGSVTGAPSVSGQIIPWENGIYLNITESESNYISAEPLPIEEWSKYLYYKQE